MEHETGLERVSVLRVSETTITNIEDVVARELALTIILNNEELVTVLCTPSNLDYLVTGFLLSEGLIKSRSDITSLAIDEEKGLARVETAHQQEEERTAFKRIITSGCGRGPSFYSAADAGIQKVVSNMKVVVGDLLRMVKEFQHYSSLFHTTGGVHSAALGDHKNLLLFNEDIGRHNAIDKIFGECIIRDISTEDRLIISSGRISSEMLLKVAHKNVPIVVSPSAPTSLGVKLARQLGVTLVGFVRGKRMNVYSGESRILP